MGDVPRNRTNKSRQAIICHAHKKNGEPCGKWALVGQLVCRTHGGMSPNGLRGAEMRLAEDKARRALAQVGVRPVGNALEELAQVAGECVAWKNACAAMVNKLREDEIRYSGREGGALTEQIRAELLLWERSLDRCVTVLSSMARLGLDERLVVIEEKKAAKVLAALSESVSDAGLDADTAELVRIGFARRIRAITSKTG